MKNLALLAVAGLASTATAQDLLICVDDLDGDGLWTITAEYIGTPPTPIVQAWADTSFALTGDGADITINNDFNTAYNTTLGDAVISNNGDNATFVGNANAFFGTPDASNPLFVATFNYAGDPTAINLALVGQNSVIFDLPPFGDVQLYQDATGAAGPQTFAVEYKIPAPASAALLGLGGLAAVRRRR
ncbi:MAG: PEP-CTERM sorting domain-containing protein [Planctomycetota bacterium]